MGPLPGQCAVMYFPYPGPGVAAKEIAVMEYLASRDVLLISRNKSDFRGIKLENNEKLKGVS